MKVIAISGVIGWDVLPEQIRSALDEASGEDVEIQVSSPGGFVFDGLEIFNLLRNYSGRVTTRLMGLAASMASYIVLAGEHVIAEDNAVFLIHNVSAFSGGDHRDMRKTALWLEGLSAMLARAYVLKSGKPTSEIRGLMDEETFLFGDEILGEGFVDEIAEHAGDDSDKASAFALAKTQIMGCLDIMAKARKDDDLNRAVALLGDIPTASTETSPAAPAEKTGEARKMPLTLESLKAEHSDIYQAAVSDGIAGGVKAERERVTKLKAWVDAEPACAQIVDEAIVSGKGEDDVRAQLTQVTAKAAAAAVNGGETEPENPPDVTTAPTGATPTGETDESAQKQADEVYARLPKN